MVAAEKRSDKMVAIRAMVAEESLEEEIKKKKTVKG